MIHYSIFVNHSWHVFCSMKRLVDMVGVDVVGVDEWDDVVRV